MIKKDSHKTLIQLLAISMITIVFWIGFEIFYLSTEKEQTDIPEKILTPLNPLLNQEVLTGLQERISPAQDELNQVPQERKIKFESQAASSAAEPENQ